MSVLKDSLNNEINTLRATADILKNTSDSLYNLAMSDASERAASKAKFNEVLEEHARNNQIHRDLLSQQALQFQDMQALLNSHSSHARSAVSRSTMFHLPRTMTTAVGFEEPLLVQSLA